MAQKNPFSPKKMKKEDSRFQQQESKLHRSKAINDEFTYGLYGLETVENEKETIDMKGRLFVLRADG